MKLEVLPSGSYRYKKVINGQVIRKTFDHEPSDVEIALLIAEKSQTITKDENKQFVICCKEYIKIRENVIAPGTINGYESIINNMSDWFKNLKLSQITKANVQKEINDYSATHSPKSTKNYYGFIISVLKEFSPNLRISCKLPQIIENKGTLPCEKDIQTLLDEVKGTEYSIIFQLGVLGLRRSEACALTLDDLKGNVLIVNKAKVKDTNGKWIIRNFTKTKGSTREIYLPDSLVEEIRERGYIYKGSPDTLLKYLHRLQDRNNMPRFTLHSLRHYFASYAHAKGIPDVYIMQMGGWSSDDIMKKVYREAMEDRNLMMQKKMGDILL